MPMRVLTTGVVAHVPEALLLADCEGVGVCREEPDVGDRDEEEPGVGDRDGGEPDVGDRDEEEPDVWDWDEEEPGVGEGDTNLSVTLDGSEDSLGMDVDSAVAEGTCEVVAVTLEVIVVVELRVIVVVKGASEVAGSGVEKIVTITVWGASQTSRTSTGTFCSGGETKTMGTSLFALAPDPPDGV
jgi:hypothetical protein